MHDKESGRKAVKQSPKVLTGEDLQRALKPLREKGELVTLCHGVFDLLHPGHLRHLEEAKSHADVLVVSVTSDSFVNKGPGRPVFSTELRAAMLAALEIVDFVWISDFPTAMNAINLVQPNFFVKGPDYTDQDADISGNISREVEAVEKNNGAVIFTTGPTMSSSTLINSSEWGHNNDLRMWLESLKKRVSAEEIRSWVEKMGELKVLVIGEIIVDRYVFCDALAKTSKEPVLAFLEKSHEEQLGGSVAIARHVAGLGAKTTLLGRLGKDSWGASVLNQIDQLPDFEPVIHESTASKTIVKTRFIDEHTGTKVFETYEMTDGPASESEDREFIDMLDHIGDDFDVILVADYGHGLLSDKVIDALCQKSMTLSINTQSNAGNRGFNSISRYPKANIVSLNGGELTLELRKRHTTVPALLPELGKITSADWIVVTEGARGLAVWNQQAGVIEVPAFTEQVKDRVGAGDALFAAVSLALMAGAPAEVVGLLGNLAGASMVSDLGNRYSLNSVDLIRYAQVSLK